MQSQIDLDGLTNFINDEEIPLEKSRIGFLEIIRKSHNETINSNLYAFFLSCENQYIKSLFLDALLGLVKIKSSKELDFNDYIVNTEVTTSLGRIDIVLQDLMNQNSIIIENKIFHTINNPLEDYWRHYKIKNSKKVGVLLTLHPHKVPEEVKKEFINITHWEWISKVKSDLDLKLIRDDALKIYLTDFINTIENMSSTNQINKSAKFFFEHAKKVNQAHETIIEGHRFMIEQYRLIASKLGLNEYGNDISYKSFWDEHNKIDTYFTITTYDIIQGEGFKYKIIIELFREDKNKLEGLRERFKEHKQYDSEKEGEKTTNHIHFLVKEYDTSIDNLNRFADDVVGHIKKDFANLYVEMVEHLYPEKDISSWKQSMLSNSID
jgi:hypothetical protein